MSSVFNSPNPIFFGRGTSKLTGGKLKEFGCKKVLVIFDKGIKAAGIVDKILDNIKASGIETVLFDKVEPDPPDYIVNEAGALGLAEKVDGLVGIGGGSSMDTAKGARILLTFPAPINRYFGRGDAEPLDERNMKPVIVIPTTAGTGSEATPGGIITDTEKHVKWPIICSVSMAIIDPELTVGLPSGITASTGFDALCHAAEALTSKAHNRISEVLAKEAITLIARNLPVACREGSNIEAREGMSLAATLAGMSLRGPFGGIPHDIGTLLGARYGIPHGTAVGCLLAESMNFIAPVIADKVKIVAECMGAEVPANSTPEEIGIIARNTIRNFYKEVNMPKMKALIPDKQDMLQAEKLFKGTSFTPRALTREHAKEILENSYDAS
ncbi:MAG TPA: iron-containing alcohol dehydrogenase [Firmicutes bacterium]|jgi:alcohol dehydrogenase|nr:iron-containing alcohol dehydrogenase [Bacillota bacterium]